MMAIPRNIWYDDMLDHKFADRLVTITLYSPFSKCMRSSWQISGEKFSTMDKDYPSLPSYQKSPRMRRGQRITLDNGGLTGGGNRPIRRQHRGTFENEAELENEDEEEMNGGYKPSRNSNTYRRNGTRNNREVSKVDSLAFPIDEQSHMLSYWNVNILLLRVPDWSSLYALYGH